MRKSYQTFVLHLRGGLVGAVDLCANALMEHTWVLDRPVAPMYPKRNNPSVITALTGARVLLERRVHGCPGAAFQWVGWTAGLTIVRPEINVPVRDASRKKRPIAATRPIVMQAPSVPAMGNVVLH